MNQQADRSVFKSLRRTLTPHRLSVGVGLLLLPYCLFSRFTTVVDSVVNGYPSVLLLAVALGLSILWGQRRPLAALRASAEDRMLGGLLIFSTAAILPICQSSIWAQNLLGLLLLLGIACSCWGMSFFSKYALPAFLITLGLVHQPGILAKTLWQALTPPQFLERLMAWAGTMALNLIGQPATVQGTLITLPKGAVEVEWGCNGFFMAQTMAIASLVLGIWLHQSRSKILIMMILGSVLALIFNIPRIMLVTVAAVYWGKDWFRFWHGFWGGQIFVAFLFTVYYYGIMAVVKRSHQRVY
ncbi:MAG TPA: cyanoexosortase C [Coleofasciculaceae cyanobacterium]